MTESAKAILVQVEAEADSVGYEIPLRYREVVAALGQSFDQSLFDSLIRVLRRNIKAHKLIQFAEKLLGDEGEILSYELTTDVDGFNIRYRRAVHSLRKGEKFAIIFAMVTRGLGLIEDGAYVECYRSLLYGGGKGSEEIYCIHSYASEAHTAPRLAYLKKNNTVEPVDEVLAVLLDLAKQHVKNSADPDDPLSHWIRGYLSDTHGNATAPDSSYTDQPHPTALPLGLRDAQGTTLWYSGERSLITIAPPGSGKSQCHVIPTLMHYQGPAIVLDIKGECYAATAEWRRNNIGPVFRLNPVESDTSARYNPLALLSDATDNLWEEARFMADLLVVMKSAGDPTWETQGKELLTLFLAYVVALHEPEDRSIGILLDLLATIGLQEMLGAVSAAGSPFPSAMRRTAARFSNMMANAPKQFEGVLSGVSQHMQVWEGPKVERVTSGMDWHPEDFRKAPYPTLYLCIPPNAIETYAPLLRVIIGQHIRRLTHQEPSRSTPNLLLLLDELPRLGRMEPVREALEVGRSYRMKLWMFAQHMAQLEAAYPHLASGMVSSCGARIFMNPSLDTAEKISKEFGKKESLFSDKKEDRLNPLDIIGNRHRDSIFVLGLNEEPMILKKQFFFNR